MCFQRDGFVVEMFEGNGICIQETGHKTLHIRIEKHIEQRHAYLYKIREYRQENRPIIYTDETWVNAHHAKDYIWVDCDGGGWKVPSGKGQRLIVLHAGGMG